MKKLFNLFFFLFTAITISAQHRAFVWNHDRSIYVSTSQPDSITFTSPKTDISLSTGDPTEVTDNAMTAYFVLKSNYSFVGKDVELGVCYSSIDEQPTIDNSTIVYASEVNSQTWEQTIDKLDKGRTYYYRSYAKIGDEVTYGPTKSFATGSAAEQPATPSYVDLGLSVKWATCNLGATKPEDYGNYYAWGETLPKDSYSWGNYKYGVRYSFSKYNETDGKRILDADDDAATVNLGRPWRTPTLTEVQELVQKCTWKWTTVNNINGFRVIGLNGNAIFLPTAGCEGDYGYTEGKYGIYMSSSKERDFHEEYRSLSFFSDSYSWGNLERYKGATIRPVRP